jgi:hypothetical protein
MQQANIKGWMPDLSEGQLAFSLAQLTINLLSFFFFFVYF